MVIKGEVLLRVQDLQEGCRRVATEIGAHLVNFIQAKDRVIRFGLLKELNDFSRKRSNIRSSVSSYFGLIPNPSEREANEISPGGPRHRLG